MFTVFNFRHKIKYDHNIDPDLIHVSDDYGRFVKNKFKIFDSRISTSKKGLNS